MKTFIYHKALLISFLFFSFFLSFFLSFFRQEGGREKRSEQVFSQTSGSGVTYVEPVVSDSAPSVHTFSAEVQMINKDFH